MTFSPLFKNILNQRFETAIKIPGLIFLEAFNTIYFGSSEAACAQNGSKKEMAFNKHAFDVFLYYQVVKFAAIYCTMEIIRVARINTAHGILTTSNCELPAPAFVPLHKNICHLFLMSPH